MFTTRRQAGDIVRLTVPPSATPTVVDVKVCDIRPAEVQVGVAAPAPVRIDVFPAAGPPLAARVQRKGA